MKTITAKELKVKGQEFFTLDIREPYEYEIVNNGALNIPMGEIPNEINRLPKDKTIVVICKTGSRATAVANLLLSEYQLDVAILEGGIMAWIDEVDNTLEKY